MTKHASKVTLHMAASLDFRVAKDDGSMGWLETSDTYEKGVDGESAEAFMQTIGCFVMGSKTYELATTLGWPYGDVPTIVLTRRKLTAARPSVEFRSGDLNRLVDDVLKPRYDSIWLVGGPLLAREFIRANLVDEISVSILPVLLGEGTPFVDRFGGDRALHLKNVTAHKNGIVELRYEIKR